MNATKFLAILAESRNGANEMYRHALVRSVIMSDGVKELADQGCHWLLDIVATELPAVFRSADKNPTHSTLGFVHVVAKDGKASIDLRLADDTPPAWRKHIDFTTLPDCDFTLYMSNDDGRGQAFTVILPSEY